MNLNTNYYEYCVNKKFEHIQKNRHTFCDTFKDNYLHVSRNSHENVLSIGGDPVEEERIVQGRVPRCLKSEHLPVVAGYFNDLAREEAERQHRTVAVLLLGLRSVADAADDQLTHVAPAQLGSVLVDDGDAQSALDALMKQEQAAARQVVAVLDHAWHVLATWS